MNQHREKARTKIDEVFRTPGRVVQCRDEANVFATDGMAVCELPLKRGCEFAGYPLYVDFHD